MRESGTEAAPVPSHPRDGERDAPAARRATKRLVLADPLSAEGMEVLENAPGLELDDRSGAGPDALKEALPGAAALIVRSRTTVDAELLDAADALEVIGRAGVGVDNIDVDAATRRGIAVVNAPGGNTLSTAELTWGLILAAARRIPEADASVRAGRWDRKRLRGAQLHGRTLGVVGAGRIGSAVIRRARAFGLRVLVHDPYLTDERAADLGLDRVSLDRLLERADVVTLHVPLTRSTRGMIGREAIGRMKEGAILVNAARGGLVDEAALAEALEAGTLAGAALDVFQEEPLPADSPLRSAPGLVLTPHVGAATWEARKEVAREIAVAVRDALLTGDYGAALNAPYVEPADREHAGPIMELGRRLGALLAELTAGRSRRVEVRYAGSVRNVLRPLAAAAMEGYLRSTVDRPLNVVNALAVAAERGIEVGRVRAGEVADYSNYVELVGLDGEWSKAGADAGADHGPEIVVGGALLSEGQHARIVRIGDFHVDTVPRGVLLLVRNRDVPGVIGQVGTKLGDAGINIAEYHQARREAGGDALGVITVDDPVPPGVVEGLRELPAVEEVRQVSFREGTTV